MLQKESIRYKKLTKAQWKILKNACPYLDIHHIFGKQSEQLCLLKPMMHEDHLHNHSKHTFLNNITRREKIDNLRYWKLMLIDYEYEDFKQKDLLWI